MFVSKKSLKFEQNLWGSFKCMVTVIFALFIRETYTLYGESKFGYVWVVFRDLFSIVFIIAIRYFFRQGMWEGMSMIFYYLLGFILFYIFTESVSKCVAAASANSSILSFPHVTVLDIMISRCILVVVTNLQAGFILAGAAVALDFTMTIYDYGMFFYCFTATCVMGFTVGLFLGSVSQFYPFVGKLWNMSKIFLMIGSGVIVPLDRFNLSSATMELIYLNPLYQLVEGIRQASSIRYYLVSHVDFGYLNIIILTTGILGLLLTQSSKYEDQ